MTSGSPAASGSVTTPTLRILRKRSTLAPPSLATQLAKHGLGADELIVEDLPRDGEQLPHRRIAQGVPDGRPFLARRHDILRPEHGELLGNHRLLDSQRVLELLNRPSATGKDLQHPDSQGMGQGFEKLRLEDLERAGE